MLDPKVPPASGNNDRSNDAASLSQSNEAQSVDTVPSSAPEQESPKDIHEVRMEKFEQNAKEIAAMSKFIGSQNDPSINLTAEEAQIVEEQRQKAANMTAEDVQHLQETAGDFHHAAEALPSDAEFAAFKEEAEGGKTWTDRLAAAKSIVLGSKIVMRVGKYFGASRVVAEVGESAINYKEAVVQPPKRADIAVRKQGDLQVKLAAIADAGRNTQTRHLWDGMKGVHTSYLDAEGLATANYSTTKMKTTENTLALIKRKYDAATALAKYRGEEALAKSIDKFTRPLSMAHDAAKTWNEADKINTEWTENRRYFDLGKNISKQAHRNRQTRYYLESQRDRRQTQVLLYEFERSKFNNALR